nr:hypothetical protein BaRGS_000696 [Batillaria attramentaria]
MKFVMATFLMFVVYLNLNLAEPSTDPLRRDDSFQWEGDIKLGWPRPVLSVPGHLVEVKNDTNVDTISNNSSSKRQAAMLIYPTVEQYREDRVVNQLSFISQDLVSRMERGEHVTRKKILLYSNWDLPAGQSLFRKQNCVTQACELVHDRSQLDQADVVVVAGDRNLPALRRRSYDQILALFLLESPYHTGFLASSGVLFNWTATYRHDSTIVAPYEKYVPFNASLLTRKTRKNYAAGKTKKVAWFVSNCATSNNRLHYATELGKYIRVDIYGDCGPLNCSRYRKEKCFELLNTDYKFYLSFENSNCRDYITEKFFINGLKHDVVPIVMGAAPEDYKRAAPPHSFIHVDYFQSPKHLAAYLHKLDHNDSLYNEYFAWKGLWDNINTYFWCRVCALAHDTKFRGASCQSDEVGLYWTHSQEASIQHHTPSPDTEPAGEEEERPASQQLEAGH